MSHVRAEGQGEVDIYTMPALFMLKAQIPEKLVDGLNDYLDELREDKVSVLISCGGAARRNRQYALASKYIVKSILISPWLVVCKLHRRNFFSRLFRKLGRTLFSASRIWR